MDMMTMDDLQAVNMVLRECSTYIPVELEHDVAIVDLQAVDFDRLGRGLSNSNNGKQRLLQAYRPDERAVQWWLNGAQSNRKLKCKTTPRVKTFDRQLNITSVNDKRYTLSAKGRGRYYLGFGIRVFGQNHTAYIHNLIGAEVYARVYPSRWTSWAKSAWNEDHLVFNGYTVHHLLPYQTSSVQGNTPLNLILLDDWTHETTKVQYNSLRRRIIDGDIDLSKTLILPKSGAMQALQNIPVLA